MVIKFEVSNKNTIKRLIIRAFLIRVIVLVIIACSGNWERSFINQVGGVTDDYKYEMGATLFAENASNLFDVRTFSWAFNSVDASDWTGTHLNNPISYSVFWYLIVCLLVWITKTKYSIRVLNILLACLSIKYIYNFANKVWGENVANKACKLFAYLPYPIVFCCFGYKEELVMFCTFYLLSRAVDYRYGEKLSATGVIKLLLVAIMLLGIRSGISLIFFAVCITIMFFPDPKAGSKITIKKIIPFILMFVVAIYAFVRFGGAIAYKANAYLGGSRGGGDTISALMINGIADVWKLPLSYVFSIIMPISLFKTPDSWLAIIDTLNIVMVPISVGAGLYAVYFKKPDKIVYWGALWYYLLYVITSLNIFRQYASLLPLNLIFFSAFSVNANFNKKMLMYVGSALMSVALIAFFLIKRKG